MADRQPEPVSSHELRQASFPQALRGYDRESVHAFLERVADWIEGAGASAGPANRAQSEFAKVGERTAGILTAAEEAASKLRSEAEAYAERLRASAQEESRKATLTASQRADELIAEAEGKAERIIDEAIARRRGLNQAVSSLLERRDEIAAEAQRLADDLLDAVDFLHDSPEADERDEEGDASGDPDDSEPERGEGSGDVGRAEEPSEGEGEDNAGDEERDRDLGVATPAAPDEHETAVFRADGRQRSDGPAG